MADFFDEMAVMARDLLRPSDQGGLGAKTGSLKYVRIAPGAPPTNEWEPDPEPVRFELPIRGQSFGIGKELVGTEIENTVLVSSDLYVVAPVIFEGLGVHNWWTYYFLPTGSDSVNVSHVIELDGVAVIIVSVEKIPAVGTTSALRFIVRK